MQLKSNPLPAPKRQFLSEWLKSEQFDTLITVLESKAFKHEVAGANYAMEATSLPNMVAKSGISFSEAADVRKCIAILIKLQGEVDSLSAPPEIFTAEPTTTP
jgi:hypothetical protein